MVAVSSSSRTRTTPLGRLMDNNKNNKSCSLSGRVYMALTILQSLLIVLWLQSNTSNNSDLMTMTQLTTTTTDTAAKTKTTTTTQPQPQQQSSSSSSCQSGTQLLDVCFCHPGYQGDDCSQKMDTTSTQSTQCGPYDDRCFFHPDYGVAVVSEERWKGAQQHESDTWAQQRTSDRNDEHAQNFEQYATLLFLEEQNDNVDASTSYKNIFGNMMEFGAGPFTQSMTVFETIHRNPTSMALLEPMAKEYMANVQACRYKNGTLGHGIDTKVLPYPAEQLQNNNNNDNQKYDTIMLLNFIEHVKDAFLVYNIAFGSDDSVLKPGGLVIFHERYWPGYDGTETKNRREFDLHPIRLNQRFAHWMATEFDLLYEKEQAERWGNLGYYWIGRKHDTPMEHLVQRLRVRMDAHAQQLADRGWVENKVWGNIYNGRDLEQSREYMSYVRNSDRVKTICEVGFAGGHSTVAYMTANPDATIYSFDDFGKAELTQIAYDVLKKEKKDIYLQRGDSTQELVKFAAAHPDVLCDVISVDGAHHAHFPDVDLTNFKYMANYPNVVLIDDYHKQDWPAVHGAVAKRTQEGSMKVRHVSASSIVFRNKQKQWAIGEYTLLTVVIATRSLKRLDTLKKTIAAAKAHPVVQQVIVIWNGPETMPSEVAQLAEPPNRSARVTVIQKDVNSLNNRYDPSLPIHTGAVMIVDDDNVIRKETIDCAFFAWKKDPSRLYAFGDPRVANSNGYQIVPQGGVAGPSTNFLLPRMVFHRKFLSVYFSQEHKKLRDYVDTHVAHCDDLAFASVITKYTGKPMVHVPAPYTDHQGDGLGTVDDRVAQRVECTKYIIDLLDWTLPKVDQVGCPS